MTSLFWRRLGRLVVLRRVYLFELSPHSSRSPSRVRLPDEYELEFPADPSRLSADALHGGKAEYAGLRSHLDEGDLLGLVWIEGRIAHRSLVQSGGVVAVEGRRNAFVLAPGERYIRYCETTPEHYGRGLYPAMLSAIAAHFESQDEATRLLISCRASNHSSVRGILKAGYWYASTGISITLLGERVGWTRWRQDIPPSLRSLASAGR